MKKCLLLAAMLCSSSAFAATGNSYFGAGYHFGSYEEKGFPSADPSAIKLEYGQYFTDSIAVEAHLGLGLTKDTVTYDAMSIDFEIQQSISLFLKGDIHLSETVNLYGLVGATRAKLKLSSEDISISDSDSGLSYGVGVEADAGDNVFVSAEYIVYLSEDDYDYSGINIGIAKKF